MTHFKNPNISNDLCTYLEYFRFELLDNKTVKSIEAGIKCYIKGISRTYTCNIISKILYIEKDIKVRVLISDKLNLIEDLTFSVGGIN